MIKTEELSDTQWQAAHQIAINLAKGNNANELRKAIAYLKTIIEQGDAGKSFFSYLITLARNGDKIGHSTKTKSYYQNILNACDNHLVDYKADAVLMLQVLGWSARLIKYYQNNPVAEDSIPDTEFSENSVSKRQEEIAKQIAENDFSEGQIVDATVVNTNPKGKKVTYLIVGTTIKLTNKESKYFNKLSVEQKVRLTITRLEDDKIKKAKLMFGESKT